MTLFLRYITEEKIPLLCGEAHLTFWCARFQIKPAFPDSEEIYYLMRQVLLSGREK